MLASSSDDDSDDEHPPLAQSSWAQDSGDGQHEGDASSEEEDDDASSEDGDSSDGAGDDRAPRVEAPATKGLSLGERLRRLDAAADAAPPPPPPRGKNKRRRRDDATVPGRASKNAPAEASSRRRAPGRRGGAADVRGRDPRFDALSTGGDAPVDAAAAARRYAFLGEKERAELAVSRAYLRTRRGRRDAAAKTDHERRVSRQRQREHDERTREVKGRFRREERAAVRATGKAPYYVKQSVLRGAVAQDRFADLKKRGKLGAFLAKKGRRTGPLEAGARRQGRDPGE